MTKFIGLSREEITKSTNSLSQLLANTYLVYLQTQNFHWNIMGENFYMLHLFLESQYQQLAEATDEIAERIRMLGEHAPATASEFLKLSTISECVTPDSPKDMITILLGNHEKIIAGIRSSIAALKDSADEGTVDFFIERLRAHEKMSWMLRSHLV